MWRFRILLAVVLVALAAVVVVMIRAATSGEGNPGLGGGATLGAHPGVFAPR